MKNIDDFTIGELKRLIDRVGGFVALHHFIGGNTSLTSTLPTWLTLPRTRYSVSNEELLKKLEAIRMPDGRGGTRSLDGIAWGSYGTKLILGDQPFGLKDFLTWQSGEPDDQRQIELVIFDNRTLGMHTSDMMYSDSLLDHTNGLKLKPCHRGIFLDFLFTMNRGLFEHEYQCLKSYTDRFFYEWVFITDMISHDAHMFALRLCRTAQTFEKVHWEISHTSSRDKIRFYPEVYNGQERCSKDTKGRLCLGRSFIAQK